MRHDYSLYEGVGGKLYTLIQLHIAVRRKLLDKFHWFKKLKWSSETIVNYMKTVHSLCLQLIGSQRKKFKDREIAFYTGESGIYALGVHLGVILNDSKLIESSLNNLIDLFKYVCLHHQKLEYELLYGVPGFLYSLLYVNQCLDNSGNNYKRSLIKDMALKCLDYIIQHGHCLYEQEKKIKQYAYYLVYTFYGAEYTGGAHGLSGNLVLLISVYKQFPDLVSKTQIGNISKILKSLEFMLSLQNTKTKFKVIKLIFYNYS
jgi:hypothetical protein